MTRTTRAPRPSVKRGKRNAHASYAFASLGQNVRTYLPLVFCGCPYRCTRARVGHSDSVFDASKMLPWMRSHANAERPIGADEVLKISCPTRMSSATGAASDSLKLTRDCTTPASFFGSLLFPVASRMACFARYLRPANRGIHEHKGCQGGLQTRTPDWAHATDEFLVGHDMSVASDCFAKLIAGCITL